MKQNIDCMKSVLRVLEEELSLYRVEDDFYIKPVRMNRLMQLMESNAPGFAQEEIAYSVLQLIQKSYIKTTGMDIMPAGREPRISFGVILYITPEGHDFLSNQ